MILIDGKNKILGRISTVAAKQALLGEDVRIINCEHIIITGKKNAIIEGFKRKRNLGTPNGPYYIRVPERLVKRSIRGMLPYKQPKGDAALKKIKCYRGEPEAFKNMEPVKLKNADISKLNKLNYVTIGTVCKLLGGKE